MEMKNSHKLRTVVISLVTILLCLILSVAGTFALFSDEVSIKTHLKAGNLKATLIRTTYSYSALDDDGYLATTSAPEERKNINANTLDNVFDLTEDTLIVPGSVLSATFKITNNDDVAFDYTVKLIAVNSEGVELEEQNVLLSQLSISVTDSVGTNDLAEDATSLEVAGVKTITCGESEIFTVDVTFDNLDNSVNNLAQGETVIFDLVVTAIQKTDRPSA